MIEAAVLFLEDVELVFVLFEEVDLFFEVGDDDFLLI